MVAAGGIPSYHNNPNSDDSDTDERPSRISLPLLEDQPQIDHKLTELEEVKVVLTGMLTIFQPCYV